jgi:hypothetical protein
MASAPDPTERPGVHGRWLVAGVAVIVIAILAALALAIALDRITGPPASIVRTLALVLSTLPVGRK